VGRVKLADKALFGFCAEPFVAVVERHELDEQLFLRNLATNGPSSLAIEFGTEKTRCDALGVRLPDEMRHISEGDILRLNSFAGEVRVLYRRNSRQNFLFFTERCNSRCLMCSQPPRDVADGYLVEDILRCIPWMAKDTPELGITGGEPTLLHDKLIEVLAATKKHLPATTLHMLSNGRLFCYVRYAEKVAAVGHPDLMIGVPLYADTEGAHDFVVQARGAFEQTLLGLVNLGRVGVRVELRMVVHRHTYARLAQFAQFVVRNLPFVDQVVIMGLELMGFARSNLDNLWIDPVDYQDQLEECVLALDDAGIRTFIYNHPLCLLRPSLRPYARKSISDWKNIYLPECEGCHLKQACGGFFASATLRRSPHIHAENTSIYST
jgi:His-Xaa-Ser system radical SAM maturase HxsC